MTSSNTTPPYLHAGETARDERVPLIHPGPRREGYPDAAWCPRSGDLVAELATLLAELKQQGLEVRRVVYNPELWGRAPRRTVIDTRPIDLGTSRAFYPHLVRLFLTGGRPYIDLLVLFPTGHGVRPQTPAVIPPSPQWRELTPQQVWESEGGHLDSANGGEDVR